MTLGVLCPGQGSQYPGMLDLLRDEPARSAIDQAGHLLGLDLWSIAAEGGEALFRNEISQPLICAAQFAAWRSLAPLLPRPRVFAGYSIGELSAYGCASALELESVIGLAQARALAMNQACAEASGLIAVRGLGRSRLTDLARSHRAEIAIVNGPDRMVVGGRQADLLELGAALATLGASVTPLQISVASHTSLMKPAITEFESALSAAAFAAPSSSVLAGIDGALIADAAQARRALASQLGETVEWSTCLDRLGELGCTALLELGPGDALSRMAEERLPGLPCRSISSFRTLAGVAAWVDRQR